MPFTKKAIRMTEGAEWKNILAFALPLMLGNLFQQLYNTVDSIVVGNFVGKEALAAVGSVDPIINTFIGFFSGLSAGAGVVISQYFGAKDNERVSKAVQSTIAITLIMSVITTILAIISTPLLLRLLGTPDDVWVEAKSYLDIYFLGVTGLLFYNMGSGIMRAVGDSTRPLIFLVLSALINTVLDIIFVALFHWGVAGAAYATIIAQGVSAALILVVLTKEKGPFRIVWKKVRLYKTITRQIVFIGLPTAIQLMVTAFSNVFVQSYINYFGSAAMAGWTSYSKIDKFCLLPVQSIGLAITTFTGQNLGAGLNDRAMKGIKSATWMNFFTALALIIILWIFAPGLVMMFNQDKEVIHYGTLFLRLLSPFFVCNAFNQVHNGALKGAGNTRTPMIIMMSTFIVSRQIYLFIVSRTITTMPYSLYATALGYPFGWVLCTIILAIYYKRVDISQFAITDNK